MTLTQKEQARLQVLNSLLAEHMTLDQAATLMGVSARHTRRILAAYREEGAAALAHGHRGRRAPNTTPEPLRSEVLRLARSRYSETNHTHLSELLREREGIEVGRTTLRRILTSAGLKSPRFRVSGRPSMRELTGLMEEAGFGTVEGRHLDSMKGVHVSGPGGGYNIYYRQDLWDGAAEHTMLHEAYEIIHETLCDMESNSPPERKVCREADRFAAAALMQPQAFSLAAERSGLDVLALQRTYRCSYASVTLRLAEVMENRPLMTVLYEREEKGDPAGWAEPPALSATVVRRTRGFGNPVTFPICGERGGVPRRGRPLSPGSLAERAVRSGFTQYAHEDGYAAIARPVLWKGRLAKVVVVAVPDGDQAVLGPQLVASDLPARRRRPVAAGPW